MDFVHGVKVAKNKFVLCFSVFAILFLLYITY
jgi:hypothetical protein